jgi:DNA-binding CsgD family transcriptional regulator
MGQSLSLKQANRGSPYRRFWPPKGENEEGTVIKSEREMLAPYPTRRHGDSPHPHNATGVILFNSTGQLLFMNNKVPSFFQRLQPGSTRECGTCLIPAEIHTVVRELTTRLQKCEHSKECRSIHVEQICHMSEQQLLIRGWCVPHETVVMKSRLLIVLETLQQPVASPEAKIQDRYHLTEREQMVIIYLMLGFTNKEIANRLALSEHTVKEHLKRMMQKTQTTSRTGLLSCMIFPMSERGGQRRALPLPAPSFTTIRPLEVLTAVG